MCGAPESASLAGGAVGGNEKQRPDGDGGQSQRNDRTDAGLQGVGISGRQKLCDTG